MLGEYALRAGLVAQPRGCSAGAAHDGMPGQPPSR